MEDKVSKETSNKLPTTNQQPPTNASILGGGIFIPLIC
jgi:hypothetical protein